MDSTTLKSKIIDYVKANPGQTSFDIRCGATDEPLTEQLKNRVNSLIARLVETETFYRVPIDADKLHKGYYFWYNNDRIELPGGISDAQLAIKNKAQEKVDFILDLIETNPGITSMRIRTKFALLGHGAKETATGILADLTNDKLIQRKQIQPGNPGAGYCYWAADAKITQLVVKPFENRVPFQMGVKPKENDPVASFATPAAAELDSKANIEIAIRLCEIEAFRNPKLYQQFMDCAENIRKARDLA
jgi:hypothetical protein